MLTPAERARLGGVNVETRDLAKNYDLRLRRQREERLQGSKHMAYIQLFIEYKHQPLFNFLNTRLKDSYQKDIIVEWPTKEDKYPLSLEELFSYKGRNFSDFNCG